MPHAIADNRQALRSGRAARPVRRRRGPIWSDFSFGERIIILYFGAFYIAPMLMDFFFDLRIKYYLNGDLAFFWPFIFAIAYLAAFLTVRRMVGFRQGLSLPFAAQLTSKYVVYGVFLAFLIFAYQFSTTFDTSFRHTDSYASAGLIPVMTFALKTVCAIYVFASLSENRIVEINLIHVTIFLAGLYLAFVSSNDVIHAFVAVYALLSRSRDRLVRTLRQLTPKFGLPAVIIMLPLVVFGGIANKVGIEKAVDRFSDGGLQYVVDLFANRIFYHSYTFGYHVNHFRESFALGWQALEIVTFQTYRRFEIILGGDAPNETLQTVSRLNYLQITAYDSGNGAGASPGLLGSLFYFPGGVFALPLHMLYVFLVVTALDKLMGNKTYGLPVYLGGLVIFQALVDTIVDNFNLFSVGFIALVMLLILSSSKKASSGYAMSNARIA